MILVIYFNMQQSKRRTNKSFIVCQSLPKKRFEVASSNLKARTFTFAPMRHRCQVHFIDATSALHFNSVVPRKLRPLLCAPAEPRSSIHKVIPTLHWAPKPSIRREKN